MGAVPSKHPPQITAVWGEFKSCHMEESVAIELPHLIYIELLPHCIEEMAQDQDQVFLHLLYGH